MNNKILAGLLAVGGLLATQQASALLLQPNASNTYPGATNSANDEEAYVEGFAGNTSLARLYKADFGSTESGPFAPFYSTVFILDNENEPSGATITWDGGLAIECPACFLAVKDGNHDPYYYFFDLGSWDGMETIELAGFWPKGGAISHVSIWGNSVSVPEPATLGLLGTCLVLVGVTRRRRPLAS